MKKFVTLVLALVMALAIALPAMAFTTDTTAPSGKSPFELDIYLVEYNDDFFGLTSPPPSDRGYAKNEVVAAMVELYVPKGEDPSIDYKRFEIDGKSVSFNVTEAPIASTNAWKLSKVMDGTAIDSWNVATADWAAKPGKVTMKWLVFAKVTGDDASITASLIDGSGNTGFNSSNTLTVVLGGDSYTVTKNKANGSSGHYAVTGKANFKVYVDKNFVSQGLTVATSSSATYYALGFNNAGVLGVIDGNGIHRTSGDIYREVMGVYDDYVKGVFGLDYTLIGNYVRDSFWSDAKSSNTVTATVEIKPWTAYVTVPDNIVVDPPKTGDAASIVGFVMIVLAAAAVVAVKKVRA